MAALHTRVLIIKREKSKNRKIKVREDLDNGILKFDLLRTLHFFFKEQVKHLEKLMKLLLLKN